MRPVVQFDVDGVLADFMTAFTRRAKTLGYTDTITGTAEQKTWETYGIVPREHVDGVWRDIKEDPQFWLNVPALISTTVFRWIDVLQEHADIYFATARVGATAKWQTAEWLARNGVSVPTVVITPNKGDTAAALRATHAIDDKAGNAIFTGYVAKKTRSYIIDRAYNQFDDSVVGGNVRRVQTVVEFLNDVEEALA